MLSLCNSYKPILDGIQIATWNDFSEGTIIEPTVEFGFASLDTIQKFTGVSYKENDLKEIYKLFQLRKQYYGNSSMEAQLDQVSCDFASLQVSAAETLLDCIASTGGSCSNIPGITSAITATAQVGTSFSYQITASNTPTSYSASGLPAGLSINTSTGLISGTPQTGGTVDTYSVTIGAINSSGTGTKTLAISVESPFGGAAASIPGTIQVEKL
ncbi:MAG: putative Ig domain-containing protein [Ferruginibacter sp.]